MSARALVAATLALALASALAAEPLRLPCGALHCAFTDLARFRGELYVAYREASMHHIDCSGRASVVVRRLDLEARAAPLVARLAPPAEGPDAGDPRDPHFVVVGGELVLLAGVWRCARRDVSAMYAMAARTRDGRAWARDAAPVPGTQRRYVWRAALGHDGRRVLLAARQRRGLVDGVEEDPPEAMDAVLLASDDGARRFAQAPLATLRAGGGDEAALLRVGGLLYAVVRGAPSARLAWAAPPYRDWASRALGHDVGGPVLFEWRGRVFLAGRRFGAEPDGVPPGSGASGTVTSVWEVRVHDKAHRDGVAGLTDLAHTFEHTRSDDTGYPGVAVLNATTAVVTYYHSAAARGDGAARVYAQHLAYDALRPDEARVDSKSCS